MYLESAFAAGIALACTLSGAALANSLHTKRAAVNKARRVASGTVRDVLGHWMNGVELRLERLEVDERTINFALNRAGILKGRLLAQEPDVLKLHQGDEADGFSAA